MDNDVEKAQAQFEHRSRSSQEQEVAVVEEEFSVAEQKSIIRRIDYRLVTATGLLYCISLIDRVNMSSANIAGMAKELQLVGNQYNIASLVFFVTYTVFQPPSTIICRALGPRLHISAITLCWGAVVVGMVVGWGNLNGVVSSNIYITDQKPRYWTGHGVVLAYQIIFLLGGSVFMHIALRRENSARRSGKRDRMLDGLSEEEKWIKGDNRPEFIYTL